MIMQKSTGIAGTNSNRTPGSIKTLGLIISIVCSFVLGMTFQHIKDAGTLVPRDFGLKGISETVDRAEYGNEISETSDLAFENESSRALFYAVWDKMRDSYVDPEKYDEEEMMYGAIKGMVESYDDPATIFFDPEDTAKFNDEKAGKYFEGIGAELGYRDGLIVIVAPIDGSPAQEAGLRSGDVIQKVDGEDIKPSETIYDVVDRIRGDAGSIVTLTVFRASEANFKEIQIERGNITVPSINVRRPSDINQLYQVYDSSYIIIDVGRFTDDTMAAWSSNWDNAVDQVVDSRAETVILDLRDNPGGYFDAAIYAASEFLPQGTIVSQQLDRHGNKKDYTVERRGRLQDTPVIVLVNEGSASSSEIVAAALQHYNRAEVIGKPTFGKGTAQSIVPFSDGSSLHITIMKWLLPDGSWLNNDNVVIPDLEVDRSPEKFKEGLDEQLEAVFEVE